MVRLLLSAGADLDYVNGRTWTPLSYIWDPQRPSHAATELIEICKLEGFTGWEYRDMWGWTPMHRAAAFGHGEDVQKLLDVGVSPNAVTVPAAWRPVHCSVKYGNESTFDKFVEHTVPAVLLKMRDARGWTLLHLAAERGSKNILLKLLGMGANPEILSEPSTVLVPEGLQGVQLSARTIAIHCNNGEIFDEAIKEAQDMAVTG
jgi:hypothetical protein